MSYLPPCHLLAGIVGWEFSSDFAQAQISYYYGAERVEHINFFFFFRLDSLFSVLLST